MNVLSIGNSFSQDAQTYLHQIAKADGFNLNAYNLYIGGCPLSSHYRNMLSEEKAYCLEVNGVNTWFKVSSKEALLTHDWDVVTLQQASLQSPYYDLYQPYLNKLVEYVKLYAPKAKIVIHQTWAYEQDSKMLNENLGYKEHTKMYEDVKACYKKAIEDSKAEMLIPSGELLQNLIKAGIKKVHRDTYHLSRGIGRYAVGLLWYSMLTGNSIKENTFCDFDEEISEFEIEIAKKCVTEICSK